jgi:arylsulfatase
MPSLSRRQFLGTGSAAMLPAALHGARKRPNVVVVLVDDMGFSDIGCYGSEIPTPNIDRLAGKGVRFTQFYNTARCSPTRASLLTGLYPHQAGMGHLDGMIVKDSKGYRGRLSEEAVTIAEVLRSAGYFTAMAGKWHLGQNNGTPPWQRGFERSLNSVFGGIYFPNQRGTAKSSLYLNGKAVPLQSPELGKDWYSTDLWVDHGLKFIDEAKKENKPFFLYVAHCAPHFPLMAPQADIDRYRGKYMAGWDKLREERYQRQIKMGLIDPRWPLSKRLPDSPAWDSLPQEDKVRFDHMMAIYAAMIDRIDRSMGTLVAGLEQRGELDNTLLLFLSDNGGNAESGPLGIYKGNPPGGPDSTVFIGMNWATLNNTPLFRYKHFTHEGGISTPLIAHWPAGIPRRRHGQFTRDPGHLIDIMATAVDVAGAKYPQSFNGNKILPMEGVSLMPALQGKPLKRGKPIYSMHEGNCAIRDGKWKLVLKYMDPWELYDIEADRTETRNLAGQYPEIAKRLAAQWDEWAKATNVIPWTGPRRTNWGQEEKK